MTEENAVEDALVSWSWRTSWKRAGRLLLAVWVFGSAAFFFIRFTTIFLHANQQALNNFLEGWAK